MVQTAETNIQTRNLRALAVWITTQSAYCTHPFPFTGGTWGSNAASTSAAGSSNVAFTYGAQVVSKRLSNV